MLYHFGLHFPQTSVMLSHLNLQCATPAMRGLPIETIHKTSAEYLGHLLFKQNMDGG